MDQKMIAFEKAVAQALNSLSLENGSNTPDFILAAFVGSCFRAFQHAVKVREEWHGAGAEPHYDIIDGSEIPGTGPRCLASPAPEQAAPSAVAEGDGGEGFTDAAFAAYIQWAAQQQREPNNYVTFFAGAEWASALATPRPAAQAVTAEMVEALDFYADRFRWRRYNGEPSEAEGDGGERARDALSSRQEGGA